MLKREEGSSTFPGTTSVTTASVTVNNRALPPIDADSGETARATPSPVRTAGRGEGVAVEAKAAVRTAHRDRVIAVGLALNQLLARVGTAMTRDGGFGESRGNTRKEARPTHALTAFPGGCLHSPACRGRLITGFGFPPKDRQAP